MCISCLRKKRERVRVDVCVYICRSVYKNMYLRWGSSKFGNSFRAPTVREIIGPLTKHERKNPEEIARIARASAKSETQREKNTAYSAETTYSRKDRK